MKTLFLSLIFCLCFAGKPQPPSTWQIYSFGNSWKYVPAPADYAPGVAQFSFPYYSGKIQLAAVLSTTIDQSLLGNLAGKTITLSAHVTETGNPVYWYGGLQSGWNTGTAPANFRFFLSPLATPYSVDDGVNFHDHWWWSNPISVDVDNLSGTFSVVVQPDQWANANGGSGVNHLAAFLDAVANVKQLGVFFSGGTPWDVGVVLQPYTGAASTFTLDSFTVQ